MRALRGTSATAPRRRAARTSQDRLEGGAAPDMTKRLQVARGLAAAFASGPWTRYGLLERGRRALGRDWPWLPGLVEDLLGLRAPGSNLVPVEGLAERILELVEEWRDGGDSPRLRFYFLDPVVPPSPPAALSNVGLPRITTLADLADWLDLPPRAFDWLADSASRQRLTPPGPLQHYHYRWRSKPAGGYRLLEIPKRRLHSVQQRIHEEILAHVPCHDAAHGFRRGRDCRTYAAPHVGQDVVVRMDLQAFFPSIRFRRVVSLFRTLGYSRTVAVRLAVLCTNSVPAEALAPVESALSWHDRIQLRSPHLPQGAPTSPALANLCAHRLDRRLSGLAASVRATYTRYADDLAFSGGELRAGRIHRFHALACYVAIDEGFALNTRKTRVMGRGGRQQLTGVVVNQHPNVRRRDYDRLKATLYNCVRSGPQSQNRDEHASFKEHLQGRIAHVQSLNPDRALRLWELFGRIEWG